MATEGTTVVNVACACKAFTYRIEFPTSTLPIPRALCLCTRCRTNSGSCAISPIFIPSTHTLDPFKYSMTKYNVTKSFDRYFCSTCGAHTLTHSLSSGAWAVSTGLWDKTEGVVDWHSTKFLEGTLDGGISVWLNDIAEPNGGRKAMKRWLGQDRGKSEELVSPGTLTALPPKTQASGEVDRLKASCLCGGVKFHVTRPNSASKAAESDFPDLIIPFYEKRSENPNKETWWLRSNNTKYLAGLCTCTTCRLASGYEIQPWAFVPKANILKEDGSPLDFEFGTLKAYGSSEGVTREFCGVCGATVFWHSEKRASIIDVSVGLLDPEEGARVEGWLEWWTGRVSFAEDAVSKSLVESLERGLKEWKQESV